MNDSRAVTVVACFGFFVLAAGLALVVGRAAVELLLVAAVCALLFETVLLYQWIHRALDHAKTAVTTVADVSKAQRATARELAEVRALLVAQAVLAEAVGPVTSPQTAVRPLPAAPQPAGPVTEPAAEVAAAEVNAWRAQFDFSGGQPPGTRRARHAAAAAQGADGGI